MSSSNKNIDWDKVIKKEALGVDGLDLGKVLDVGDTYVITQRGFIDKKRYHLPKSSAESFDGDILRLKISESDMQGYEETEDQKFDGYSSFKSSDMSKEQETKIPVMAENLDVSKNIQEDRVKIIKEPITETKTVEIELAREIITIERKPVIDNAGAASNESYNTKSGDPTESKTEISIPLKKEVPVITKKPYVKEELVVKKKPITNTKSITEDITHENIKYDNKLER